MQLMIEALQDGLVEDPEMKKQYLVTTLKEIERLSGLINDLLDLSKLELGQVDFYPSLTHIDKVLLNVLKSHSILLAEKQIDLQLEVPDTLPRLLTMLCKIARVISNLLDNAIRYFLVFGTIELIVEENKQNQQVQLILRDEGQELNPNDQLRIFEHFFRTDKSRSSQSGGSGLGLAITKSLIEMHRGEIGMRDRSNGKQGSEF
ncbi:Alkaline phosphatase synthesis sensor protein PhoR (plasmid) [Bacillus cereus]|nr:Alkaline phosphatase synthesis sensor protein PhoR [Bacillus cereus]